ncbi:hypothetical protein [Streptomyces misionensis]|nr:hypothetical protein [Streptomyces misionensis]
MELDAPHDVLLNGCATETMVESGEQAQARVSEASRAVTRLVRA